MDIVANNHIKNCPVEARHIRAADDIFGPNIGGLKGKTPRRTPPHITATIDPVPPDVLAHHQNVCLAIDVMFINKIPFFVTVARDLKYGTVEDIPNRQVSTIKTILEQTIRRYERRGFAIRTILADEEFTALADTMPEQQFNICGADDHVPEIERFIRTTKDSVRAQYNDLPFAYIPRLVLTRMVKNAVFWWNALPHNSRYSPRYVLEGRKLDFNKHVRIPFGAYAQTHEDHDNSMTTRTVGTICLGPTGNDQGSHYFMSLTSGRALIRTRFTELPLPADVIARVSDMGQQQGMPRSLTFGDRFGHEMWDGHDDVDDDHDSDFMPDDDDDDDDADQVSLTAPPTPPTELPDDLDDYPAPEVLVDHQDAVAFTDAFTDDEEEMYLADDGDTNNDENSIEIDADHSVPYTPIDEPEFHDDARSHATTHEIPANHITGVETTNEIAHPAGQFTGVDPTVTGVHERAPPPQHGHPEPPGTLPLELATGEPPQNGNMSLRPRKSHTTHPIHLLGRGFEDAFTFMTAQMSAKKGLKHFGSQGEDAILAEMQQIHYRNVIKPRMAASLTREDKRQALRYLMFLKQKRCGKIKARGCADGRKQRLWKTKDETSAPTVRTESVFLSAAIDAMEGRVVVTVDVPGAFMQADIDEFILVKFEDDLARLLKRVDPLLYTKYTTVENGKEVLYVQLQKALYGTLQAALLFWKELTRYLTEVMGFTINPYDDCVANKIIDGKQCTIIWHVDDLKISHVSAKVLEDVIAQLNERFGREVPLTVTHGPIHDYLGMTLDFSTSGSVRITMLDYISRLLSEMPDDMDGTAATPAANDLFTVTSSTPKLDKTESEFFHSTVAKLLFLCKRARPDIHTAVTFLTTRVASPDRLDYAKLRRCIRYLRGTADLPLTLRPDPGGVIQWWVDASFAVHPDMRSHTGAVLSLGGGAIVSMSTRQKLNTKSSTEAELVAVDDALPQIIWAKNFLTAQGFAVTDNVVFQDNQSTILLERNGRRSSGKRTRHIDIRYFTVTDRITRGEMRVEYCPTSDMLADLFTKPLQGSLFRRLRDLVLNIAETPPTIPADASQECVETCNEQSTTDAEEPRRPSSAHTNDNDAPGQEWHLVVRKTRNKQDKPILEDSH